MDVIAIATYLFYSLGNDRIPFYSDIVHSLSLLKDIGVEGGFYAYAVATVTLQIVLLFSLFFASDLNILFCHNVLLNALGVPLILKNIKINKIVKAKIFILYYSPFKISFGQ